MVSGVGGWGVGSKDRAAWGLGAAGCFVYDLRDLGFREQGADFGNVTEPGPPG